MKCVFPIKTKKKKAKKILDAPLSAAVSEVEAVAVTDVVTTLEALAITDVKLTSQKSSGNVITLPGIDEE